MLPTLRPNREQRAILIQATDMARKIDGNVFELLEISRLELTKALPTAAVCWDADSRTFVIYISIDILEMSPEHLGAIICHELYHILFDHVVFDVSELEGIDKEILDISQDAIINDCIPLLDSQNGIRTLHNQILDNRVKLKEINPQMNVKTHTSSDVYDYLLNKKQKYPQQQIGGNTVDDHSIMQQGCGLGGEGDESDSDQKKKADEAKKGKGGNVEVAEGKSDKDQGDGESVGDTGEGEGNSNEEKKISGGLSSQSQRDIARNLVEEAVKKSQALQQMGSGSAEANRVIGKLTKTDYNPKKLLELAVRKTLRSEVRYSFRRPSRKMGDFYRGKTKTSIPKILIVTDLSGSIDDDTIAMVNYQHTELSKHYDIHACWGDTRLMGEEKIRKGTRPKLPFVGGGGTDLNFYREVANREQFDLIIVNTDGYIPRMLDDKYKTTKIFCIYPNGIEVSGYKNIHIREKK